ncbi:MAG: hypothetical protein IPK98_06000 [Chloracidobacterium sp.]|nr:hypothetical protein [Chloracidobacterium sp.]
MQSIGIPIPPINAEKETISCNPRKYQGAFAGFSGTSGFASSLSGASETNANPTQIKRVASARQARHKKMRHRRNGVFGPAADLRRFAFDDGREMISFLRRIGENRIKLLRVLATTNSSAFAGLASPPSFRIRQNALPSASYKPKRQDHHVK